MNKSNNFLIDAGVAAGLVLALLIVIGLDKIFSSPPSNNLTITEEIKKPPDTTRESIPLRIAVTPTQNDNLGKWDDMGKLLNSLGKGYQFTDFPIRDLTNAKKLAEYDVLFLTCAPGGTESAVTSNLREFVSNGGTLYASDWRYDCVADAFPDFRADSLAGRGKPQRVEGKVLDPGLRDVIGPTIPLRFDLSKWKTAAFRGDRVKVLIQGEYEKESGGIAVAPFLVKFQFGKGSVIFTSFHNEKQNNEVETKLLKFLVFSAVTAKTEAQVTQTMIKGGFSPQKSNLLSASNDNSKIEQVYHSKKGGKIQFVLGFENRGATMTLTVVDPDGKTFEKQGTSTISIDIANGPPGAYRYTVTARVPYPDFPFTLTVGESE